MPEGDTLYRVARTLHRALAGQTVRGFDSAYVKLLRIDEEAPLRGRLVERVEARGKWCLMWLGPQAAPGTSPALRGPLVLCTHLRMNGMWHIYRSQGTPQTDERWQRPARDMRVLVRTDGFVAVGFRVPVAELLTPEQLLRHREFGQLGPDLLAEPFDEAEALRRLRAEPERELGQALLDQRAVAGLGNVYKSELCFLVGLSPFTPVRAVPDGVLRKVLDLGRRLLRENVYYQRDPSAEVVTFTGMRRTTAAMDPRSRLWVYARGSQPCRRCGAPIEQARQGPDARVTFYCPRCQPLAADPSSAESRREFTAHSAGSTKGQPQR